MLALIGMLMFSSIALQSGTLPNIYNINLPGDIVPLTHFADSGKVCETFAVRIPSTMDFTVQIDPNLDTHHVFNWQHGAPFVQGRFRGQSVDYIALNGRYYCGHNRAQTPTLDSLHRIEPPIVPSLPARYDLYIAQYPLSFNSDTYEDLIMVSHVLKGFNNNPRLWGMIMFGADSITNFRYKPIEAPPYIGWSDQSYLYGVYKTQSGTHILWQETSDNKAVIRIGKFVESDTSVMIVPSASLLYDSPGDLYQNVSGAFVYNNPITLEATLLLSHKKLNGNPYNSGLTVLSLDRDTFEFVRNYPNMAYNAYVYNRVHGNSYDDGWVARGGALDGADTNSKLFFFTGSPRDSVLIGSYPLAGTQGHSALIADIISIGDINNDGKPDHAINYSGLYEIASGSSTTSIIGENEGVKDLPIQQTVICERSQNDCRMDWLSKSAGMAKISLYNVNGQKLGTDLEVPVMTGMNSISLRTLTTQVEYGTYVVQLRAGEITSSMMLLVQ